MTSPLAQAFLVCWFLLLILGSIVAIATVSAAVVSLFVTIKDWIRDVSKDI